MRLPIYDRLQQLHAAHGPREFGKIAQKFLALAYRLAGFDHVVERGVQGVDVDAAAGGERYATEMKTTIGASIHFEPKDAAGLAARGQDGYQPLLAALRLSPMSDLYLVDARFLEPGRFPIDALRPGRLLDLEGRICPRFEEAIESHFEDVLAEGQHFLDGLLEG